MRITRVFLKNYMPMGLNGFESIDIILDKPTLLILGTNGCGKSSLLRICTPMPVPKAEFSDDGEMILECEHDGNYYVITSIYKKTARYSLSKNGIDLHVNVNGTLHQDVILKEFGYTNLMHKVLIGDLLFTEMKPAERKEVLMAICPVELQYLTKLHKDAKSALRDVMGVLKHISTKRTEVLLGLQNLHIPDGLEEERANIETELQQLLPFINNELPAANHFSAQIDADYSKLNTLKKHLQRFNEQRVPHPSITSASSLNEYVGSCNGQIQAIQKQINAICDSLDDINSATNNLAGAELTIDEILYRKGAIESSLTELVDNCYVNSHHVLYMSNIDDIITLTNTVAENLKDRSVLEFDYEAVTHSYERMHSEMTSASYAVSKLNDLLEHHKKDLVMGVCPNCKHSFNLSGQTTVSAISNTEDRLNRAKQFIIDNSDQYAKLCAQQELIVEYRSMVSSIKGLRHVYKMPNGFWEGFTPHRILCETTAFIQHAYSWRVNLQAGMERMQLLEELKAVNNAVDFHYKYSTGSSQQVAILEKQLESLRDEQDAVIKQRDISLAVLRNVELFSGYEKEINETFSRIDSNFQRLTDAAISEHAREKCSELYTKLSAGKVILDAWNNLTNTLTALDKEYEELVHVQTAWELLVENLSPSTGLIADQMLGFISSYIQQMNNILASIFTYTLQLENYDMGNAVLDYTFPLTAKHITVKDINIGSKGQKEIINMAFMLVMRQYLNLNIFPLFLDETGARFDKRHRDNLMQYVRCVLNEGLCSQLFFVNHYSDMHGGLVHHDTLVLDPTNIVIPKQHNTNVKIVYKQL